MIKKLKIKFIALAMASVCALLTVVVAGMNLINYRAVVAEADDTLLLLSENRGKFPDMKDDKLRPMPHPVSPELPYESRYFSVVLGSDAEVVFTDTGKIAAVDETAAERYGIKAFQERSPRGFIGNYRYLRSDENGQTRIVFLDCGRKLNSFHTFLYASLGMAFAGIVVVFFLIIFFSGRIIRPIARSYEKQRRFITDAGHELKTPLTIINANVDVLEMELGDNEYLADIHQQTGRLTRLTNDLVMLSRMEEAESTMQKIDFPISEVVSEAVLPFQTLAQTQRKQLAVRIQPNLTVCGNNRAVEQLVCLLMDNALKYTPAEGNIRVCLVKSGKVALLTVENDTLDGVSREDLENIFDRFYRRDTSRNSETGGYGIGLSVAQAIVNAHGGKITATAPDGKTFRITVTIPM